jgi:hypothetical protein
LKSQTSFTWRQFLVAALSLSLFVPQAAMAKLEIIDCKLTPPSGMVFVTTLMDDGLKSATSFNVICKTHNSPGNGKGNGFGIGNGNGSDNASGNGNLGSATFSIGLTAASSAIANGRKLNNGINELFYDFYQDSHFQQGWDNATQLRNITITGDVSIPITVYGKIDNSAANLKQPAGHYSDILTLTITW